MEKEKDEFKKYNNLISEIKKYAEENGFQINPNKQAFEGLVKALLQREEKFGERYCPCRRITGNKQEDKKIICPCIYHIDEIKKDGYCHCRLFFR